MPTCRFLLDKNVGDDDFKSSCVSSSSRAVWLRDKGLLLVAIAAELDVVVYSVCLLLIAKLCFFY